MVTVILISPHIGGGWEKLGILVIDGTIAASTSGSIIFGTITGKVLGALLKSA